MTTIPHAALAIDNDWLRCRGWCGGGEGLSGGGEAGGGGEGGGPRGRSEEGSPSCKVPTHSFTGGTKVLMANGSSKPISQVRVGDKIANAVPGTGRTQVHAVTNVIVTHTDHDFVDLTIAAEHPQHSTAAAAGHQRGRTVATVTAPATVVTVGKITTTFHHPFYDITKAAFVDAQHVQPGDRLQQPGGATATVLEVRLYHATQTTYDLTIGTLHTYYVEAGATPVLVHNCGVEVTKSENSISISHAESGSGVIADLDEKGNLTLMMENHPEPDRLFAARRCLRM